MLQNELPSGWQLQDRPKRADGLGKSREWIVVDYAHGWATIGVGDTPEQAIEDAELHQSRP
jgi:hypothetical protein